MVMARMPFDGDLGQKCQKTTRIVEGSGHSSSRTEQKSTCAMSQIGLIGLAVMGQNLALNIAQKGFSISVFNRSYEKTEATVKRYQVHPLLLSSPLRSRVGHPTRAARGFSQPRRSKFIHHLCWPRSATHSSLLSQRRRSAHMGQHGRTHSCQRRCWLRRVR
jgi:hypothetical protein